MHGFICCIRSKIQVMMEFFDTISSWIDQFITYGKTLFTTVTESVSTIQSYFDLLPVGLLGAAGIIIVLLIVFRILGR